jgi:peptidoglycan/LPS O-acetylase OafA/YrhL
MSSQSVSVPEVNVERPYRAHIAALDGVRGIAVLLVFLYHYGGGAHTRNFEVRAIGKATQLAWFGVTLFFVLSGFLITGILWDSIGRPHWWRKFFMRRSLRIFPLYYAALVGFILVVTWMGASTASITPVWPYFLYLQNFPGVVRYGSLSHYLSIGHFWSLAVEEQFYVVWPLLLLLANRRSRAVHLCWVVCAASLLFRVSIFAFGFNPRWVVDSLFARGGELAGGAWLALSVRGTEVERRRIFRFAAALFLTSLAGMLLVTVLSKETQTNYPWMGTIGLAFFTTLGVAILALCLKPRVITSFFETRILRWFGKLSYGIYVYHILLGSVFVWIVHALFPALTGNAYLVVLACVALIGTLLVSALSFATLESTFLRLKDSLPWSRTMAKASAE